MRPNRTLAFALLATAAALASGCAEEDLVDTAAELADPLAANGGAQGVSIVHPARGRIELTVSTTSSLMPNTEVELTIAGVAREAIDSGEVVLTLPTRALMDHDGTAAIPELPVGARWELPPMAAGETWSASHTIPGEAAGFYSVLVNAYTHGPDGGAWLFDDVLREAWMLVEETDGRLTSILEDSVSPPMAGPAAGWPPGPQARDPNSTSWHGDSVYLHVVYRVSPLDGFKPAVGAWVNADYRDAKGRDAHHGQRVLEDGIVAYGCSRAKDLSYWGDVEAPETDLVQGRDDLARWRTNASHCGTLVQVEVLAHRYYPWRLLNLAADTLQKHFGYTRGRINWGLHFNDPLTHPSYYLSFPFYEKITLAWLGAPSSGFRWTVAHEYGHALHEKALGGMWRSTRCGREDRSNPPRATSYECALQEGFADYTGIVGSVTADYPDGILGKCIEYLGTPNAPYSWCRDITHSQKPQIEWWVAALFVDLIDDNDNLEGIDDLAFNDKTHYSAYYIAGVFKTCEAQRGRWPDRWKHRSKVYDFVWCLEEYVDKPTHRRVFPQTGVPDTAKHRAFPPRNWKATDIRQTWLRNLSESGT